jgi:prevent-host-death family protein
MGKPQKPTSAIEVIGAFEAKTNLSRLLREAAAGKRFLITQRGRMVAQLGPPETRGKRREWVDMKGRIRMTDDFCEPVPELENHFS